MKWFLSCTAGILAIGMAGCGFVERKGVDTATPLLSHTVDNMMRLKSARLAESGLPSQILLISALVEFTPNNPRLLTIASQAYASYGLMKEDADPNYASEIYQIGKEYGFRALKQNGKFKKGLLEGKKPHEMVSYFGKNDVPTLFWAAMNWGQYINMHKSDPKALVEIPGVIAFMGRCIELDETYYYGGPHLFFAAYYAGLPPIMGGGAKKSIESFKKSIQVSNGKFLLPYVFYARYYTTLIKREDLFEKTLQKVLDTPSSVLPEAYLANEISKSKARFYLEHKELYF